MLHPFFFFAGQLYRGRKKLVLLVQKLVSQFQWADVVKVVPTFKDHLPVFRRNKKLTVSKEMIDIK